MFFNKWKNVERHNPYSIGETGSNQDDTVHHDSDEDCVIADADPLSLPSLRLGAQEVNDFAVAQIEQMTDDGFGTDIDTDDAKRFKVYLELLLAARKGDPVLLEFEGKVA